MNKTTVLHKLQLISSLARSLSSEITDSLRAAAARVEDSTVYISFFFNDDISDTDIDDLDAATAEVHVDVPLIMFGPPHFERRDYPTPLPTDAGVYAFSRDTPLPKQLPRSEILDYPIYPQIRISIIQALLGRFPTTLRAVCYEHIDQSLTLLFYLDANATKKQIQLLRDATAEVAADFPEFVVSGEYVDWPFPKKFPEVGRSLIRRKERTELYQ